MTLDDLARNVAHPAIEYRPELRWWLAEGLHTDETLRHEIDTAHRLGFGGMEFLAMDEQGIDHSVYGWGSEEWVHDSLVVVQETTKRNMSVSFTSGTNWSNANLPTIDPEHPAAAQELDVVSELLEAGARRSGALKRIDLSAPATDSPLPGERGTVTGQTLVAVVAAKVVGATDHGDVLDTESVIDLTARVHDESLEWSAPEDGSWRLFAYWMHGTGQTASPSASVNYTVNYLERAGVEAVIDYWDTVVLTPELREQIAQNPRTQMYMDSLELATFGAGGMFWGPGVAAEFRARRGYDIAPWLPFLTRNAPFMASSTVYHHEPFEEQRDTVEKVRFDYVRTLTDLYIENMLRPFAEFLHSVGISLRSEISYGLPFELTRPGPEVDGIENESLEFAAQIDAYRLLAGPAHLFGKQYSSETGATTRNHVLDHRFYDQIIATQLAAGITKTVLHGWASPAGAEGTEWPGHEGMWPMFSERFDTRQPASEFYRLWSDALGRYQYVLRQGRPRIDVGILRTDHFTENRLGMAFFDDAGVRHPDEEFYARRWMRDRRNFWWQDLGMQDSGWTYEFFDGSLLRRDDVAFDGDVVQPEGPGYQALIVYQSALDADDAKQLLKWAERGLKVLLVDNTRELKSILPREEEFVHRTAGARTPGFDARDDELAATIDELLSQASVTRVGDPAQTVDALRALGVIGRAEFAQKNENVLSHLRDDGDLTHLYLYHFLYETGEPTRVDVVLEGEGTAYRIDAWSGGIRPHHGARAEGGRTVITVDLAPGETALFTLDRSAAAAPASNPAEREITAELDTWSIAVDSWDAGDLQIIEEDRSVGHVTREVRPLTAVTRLESTSTRLAPWKDLDGVGPHVSGIGEYTATFTLDELDARARYELQLGSVSGGLGSVSVNGSAPVGFDTSVPVVDVTHALQAGTNAVVVRVSSSLNNRLLARGYYDGVPDILAELGGAPGRLQKTHVHDYGLLGPVRLVRVSAS
ncbi:glycosyl hydrolase [Humibacter albus]|uniref:glycosyl hydrolase n=1 Tax=Humibacter albus TaxID=427754 RepID=UPI0003B73A3D|nr:glycosyl hydrolase [Humibacter albus]